MMNKKVIVQHLTTASNNQQKDGVVAIMGGHFGLHTNRDEKTLPGIYQEIDDERLKLLLKGHPYSGEFPLETFKASMNILDRSSNQCKIVLLVNDWQWVKKVPDGTETNHYRESFYKKGAVPKSYKKVIREYGLDEKDVIFENKDDKLTYANASKVFSEQKLRNRFQTRQEYRSCKLDGECAREFVPFLQHLVGAGVHTFICFIPMTCVNPINDATRFVRDRLKLDIDVYTITIYNPIDKELFWESVQLFVNGDMEDLSE